MNSHELLVLERDGKGLGDDSKADVKRIYKIDLANAQDVTGLSGERSAARSRRERGELEASLESGR